MISCNIGAGPPDELEAGPRCREGGQHEDERDLPLLVSWQWRGDPYVREIFSRNQHLIVVPSAGALTSCVTKPDNKPCITFHDQHRVDSPRQ